MDCYDALLCRQLFRKVSFPEYYSTTHVINPSELIGKGMETQLSIIFKRFGYNYSLLNPLGRYLTIFYSDRKAKGILLTMWGGNPQDVTLDHLYVGDCA